MTERPNVPTPQRDNAADAPLVSIVIVTRNRPTLFKRAVESVYAQTYRPLELVVIDNVSDAPVEPPAPPDGVTLVKARTPAIMNASQSRNFGADTATGAFTGYLDDDDFYYPEKIANQIRAFQTEPSADFCIIDTEVRRNGVVGKMRLRDLDSIRDLFFFRPIHTNSLLIRTEVLRAERFNNALSKYTDLHLTYRLFERRKPVKAEGVGAVWVCDDRDDQLTNTKIKSKLGAINRNAVNWRIICDDFAHLIERFPDVRRKYYGQQAKFSAAAIRPFEAVRYGLAALGFISLAPEAKAAAEAAA